MTKRLIGISLGLLLVAVLLFGQSSGGNKTTTNGGNNTLTGNNTFTGTNTFAGINATSIGATTPGTGVFTSLTATSIPAAGAIGGTTPAAGSFTTVGASGQITSTLATGTAPLVIASTTTVPNLTVSNHPTVEYCGTTAACAKTQQTSGFVIFGSVAFPTASTVSLSTLPFTSSTSYACTASDLTTAAGVVNATTYTSGAAVTFTETNGTTTDTVRYVCVGN